ELEGIPSKKRHMPSSPLATARRLSSGIQAEPVGFLRLGMDWSGLLLARSTTSRESFPSAAAKRRLFWMSMEKWSKRPWTLGRGMVEVRGRRIGVWARVEQPRARVIIAVVK